MSQANLQKLSGTEIQVADAYCCGPSHEEREYSRSEKLSSKNCTPLAVSAQIIRWLAFLAAVESISAAPRLRSVTTPSSIIK